MSSCRSRDCSRKLPLNGGIRASYPPLRQPHGIGTRNLKPIMTINEILDIITYLSQMNNYNSLPFSNDLSLINSMLINMNASVIFQKYYINYYLNINFTKII